MKTQKKKHNQNMRYVSTVLDYYFCET